MDQNQKQIVEAYIKAYEAVTGQPPEGTKEQLADRIAARAQAVPQPAAAHVQTVEQAEALARAEAEQWQRQQAGQAGPGTNNPAAGQPTARETKETREPAGAGAGRSRAER